MKIIPWIIILLFIAGCGYNAQVISVDTAIDQNNQENIPPEEPKTETAPATTPAEQETAPTEELPPEEPIITETATTYEGTVIMRTGASSYRIRTTTNVDLRIFTRTTINPGDKIRFTKNPDGTITDVQVLQTATTHY
ncbi:MAG: hypothetical protein Q7R56_02150 [Nanoarchaeota archaeon]|nr:hypothetical protein [Nanoarchaeota archaeon]